MGEPVPTWGAVDREAAVLTPAEEATLETIGQLPLVPTQDLAHVCSIGSTAALYRRVAVLTRRGLVAGVGGPTRGSGPHQQLLLLDNLGLAVLSWRRGVEPAVLARRW